MALSADDLARTVLQRHLGDRPFRTFPAMLSTEAEAMSWARTGAPHGAVVVTGYQAAPRGRSGRSWAELFTPGRGMGLSMVLRPRLAEADEGWLYVAVTLALAEVLDPAARVQWPDQVVAADRTIGAVGLQTEPDGRGGLQWAVATLLLPEADPPRGALAHTVANHVEARLTDGQATLLEAFRRRCDTLGHRVRARMLPLGPGAVTVEGQAVDLAADGGLVIRDAEDRRVVVAAASLGFLDLLDGEDPADAQR